jgi:hypothetical protein
MNILDHIPEILETIFGVKMLKYLMRIRDPESFCPWIQDPIWKKFVSGILDKHPGSATLLDGGFAW